MNANELADELIETAKFVDNISNNYQAVKEIKEAATMLRQQADRIAELEKQTKPLIDDEIWNWFKENTALTKESALRIARAIEERHGIK